MIRENREKRGVLIVEDNELNREMLSEICRSEYRVFEASDGVEGLALLKEHLRDLSLVLLDVQMPKMNGYQFLETMQKDELLSSVPVIVTTGNSITENEEKCLSLGASDFVTKPYNPRIILRRMEAIIRLKESIAAIDVIEHDSLTGLYTKNAFFLRAQRLLDHSEDQIDMVLINIEDFSYLNLRYGEKLSDRLLVHFAKRIRECGEENILSCRFNVDRFVMLRVHEDCDHQKLSAEFDRALHEGAPISEFTVKYAVYDNVPKGVSIAELCDRLKTTVETIRHQFNRQVAFYDDEVIQKTARLRKLVECMEDALTDGQFRVYYQPKHDAKTGKIAGAEALIRWVHPEFGFLPPFEFIPLFEQNGFVTNVDLFVWNSVCKHIKEWKAEGLPVVPISVNASRRDFLAVDRLELLTDPIRENGLENRFLHLEITESLGIDDRPLLEKVKKIREAGFQIELDDFGSGQSSLGSICDIPMDVIKLDISFARSLDRQKEIVRMIVSLAHALGMKTVAEGVETEEHIRTLRELGCDYFQGYYYSKPLPEPEFREYLKKELAK